MEVSVSYFFLILIYDYTLRWTLCIWQEGSDHVNQTIFQLFFWFIKLVLWSPPFPKAQRLKSPLNRLPHFMQLFQNWPHHFTLYALTLPLDQTCQTPTTQQWYHTRIFNPECKQASISLAYPNGESSSERLQRKMLGQSSVIAYIPSSESQYCHYLIVEVDSPWADNHQSTTFLWNLLFLLNFLVVTNRSSTRIGI